MELELPNFTSKVSQMEEMICDFETYSGELQLKVDQLCGMLKQHIVQFVESNKAMLIEQVEESLQSYSTKFEDQQNRSDKLMHAFIQIKSILSTFELDSDANEQ